METMFFLWNKVEAITWYAQKKIGRENFEKSPFVFHVLQVGPAVSLHRPLVFSS